MRGASAAIGGDTGARRLQGTGTGEGVADSSDTGLGSGNGHSSSAGANLSSGFSFRSKLTVAVDLPQGRFHARAHSNQPAEDMLRKSGTVGNSYGYSRC